MDFIAFERALLRLKETVGVQTDKDLAHLLGLEVSALNKRKSRGSFPVEKLRDLAEQQPELKIDTNYVLTGVRKADLAGLGDRLRAARGDRSVEDFAAALGVQAQELAQVELGTLPTREFLKRALPKLPSDVDGVWLLTGHAFRLDGELTPQETILVDNFRHAGAADQETLKRLAAFFARGAAAGSAPLQPDEEGVGSSPG